MSSKRLLIADKDVKLSRRLRRHFLIQGYAVDTCREARRALKLTRSIPYDLLVLDLALPSCGGQYVLEHIRRSNDWRPVLMLAPTDALDPKVRVFEAGADDYLAKPFAVPELLARASTLLRRADGRQSSVLRLADLSLDRTFQRVSRGFGYIQLTGKEYALLEYLMQHPGQVVSRTLILQHVWDRCFSGVPAIVDVYVSRLREKIDAGFAVKLIHTVRAVGYTMRADVDG